MTTRGRSVLRIRLLGPLEVTVDGATLSLGSRQRTVLAALLLRANEVIPAERLIDMVWERPGDAARSNLRTYVAALRKALPPLGAEPRLSTESSGYLLRMVSEELDLMEFSELVELGAKAWADREADLAIVRLGQALRMWRGPPLDGVGDAPVFAAERARLEELRLTAIEDYVEARLAAGELHDLAGLLRAWIAEHPLQERLWDRLMLVLYRTGRKNEALAAYDELRERLADALGLDPSPRLRELLRQIVTEDPALDVVPGAGNVSAIPRQLPRDADVFIGRTKELAEIRGLLTSADGAGPVPIVVISGPPGMGKSALAVRAATAVADQFPDGQLYVNLNGDNPAVGPLEAREVLARFLRAFRIPVEGVPHETAEAAALLRTVLAGRRVLVVLDDAAAADQVRPLIPPAPGSSVLITTRERLATLAGAARCPLGPVRLDEGVRMLERMAGGERVAADPASARRLAELCGRVPLALHVAAARLSARPAWPLLAMVERLTDEKRRLDELEAGELTVRGSLAVSYHGLRDGNDDQDRAAARAFRLLGLLPSTDVPLPLLAAALGISEREAERLADRLVDAHLLENVFPDHYRMHDLIRLFARERAEAEESPDRVAESRRRMMEFCLVMTWSRVEALHGPREHLWVPAETLRPADPRTPAEARDWLEREFERGSLIACALSALSGPDELVPPGLGVALALKWVLWLTRRAHEMLVLGEASVEAARRIGHLPHEVFALDQIAMARLIRARYQDAHEQAMSALRLAREHGYAAGERWALITLAIIELQRRDPAAAVAYVEKQREMAREAGDSVAECYGLTLLGMAYHQTGRPHEARPCLETARNLARRNGDHYSEVFQCLWLGRIHLARGDADGAEPLLRTGLRRAQQLGSPAGTANAFLGLAGIHRLRGEVSEARELVRRAAAIVQVLNDPALEAEARSEGELIREITAAGG